MRKNFYFLILVLLFTSCAGVNIQLGKLPIPERRPVPVAKKEKHGKSHKVHKHHKGKGKKKGLKIPPGHYPSPGKCKIWVPGKPPGHQSKSSMSCSAALRNAPAGSWVLYRPSGEKSIEVKEIHRSRPGVVINVEIYTID